MKHILIALLAGIAIGAAATYHFTPIKVEERVVTREVKVKDTVTRRVVLPDGTRITERETREAIRADSDTSRITDNQRQWHASIGVNATTQGLGDTYNIQLQRRILGPVFLGVGLTTKRDATVSLGFEF